MGNVGGLRTGQPGGRWPRAAELLRCNPRQRRCGAGYGLLALIRTNAGPVRAAECEGAGVGAMGRTRGRQDAHAGR